MGVDPLAPRAVFLDRDGVLNRTVVVDGRPHPPATLADIEILPGVPAALESLARQGLLLIGVTNQPDVARGRTTRAAVEAINRHLLECLALSGLLTCYHDDGDHCDCRKPKPGLLVRAAAERGIALERSFMVGDRWSDVAAGQAAGCSTFLIDAPYNERPRCTPDYVVEDLTEAAAHIIRLLQSAKAQGGTR
jgi:D-glycero-D-manno-heptose 1,7-bisphosphate phosphatase